MQTDKKNLVFYVRNVSAFDFITCTYCDPLLSRNHLIIFAFLKLLGECSTRSLVYYNLMYVRHPGGGVLPYKGLMGTCGQPGYVFRDFCLKQGIEFIIFCLNQVIGLSIFVLNRISFLGR